jgi:hypothetical protein
MKNQFFLFFTLLFFGSATAQKVTATADNQKILIGQQFHLKLQANFLSAEDLDWFEIDTIPRFEILQKSTVDTLKLDDGVALSQNFTLTSWDSGKIQIPSFVLGNWQTKRIMIDVAYSPSPFDTTQPYHEIKEILEVKKPIEETWYWYLIFALVILLLFLLFFPKAKKKDKLEFVSDEGAYKNALKKLEKLRTTESTDARLFYTELVQIFREYLQRRKNIQSFSKTTDDLSIQMQKLNMDREQYGALLQTLRLSDLVKFARFQPGRSEGEIAIDTIKQSIITIENLSNAV